MVMLKAIGITLIFMMMFFPLTINGIWTCPIAIALAHLRRIALAYLRHN